MCHHAYIHIVLDTRYLATCGLVRLCTLEEAFSLLPPTSLLSLVSSYHTGFPSDPRDLLLAVLLQVIRIIFMNI
jgi:hypothetical protein